MQSRLNDEELIRQQLPTDRQACFHTLYQRYVHKVYQQCVSITKDTEQAHDYTQDIFMRIFDRLDQFAQQARFSTWLHSVAYNYCIDQLRLAKRFSTMPLEASSDYPAYEEDDRLQQQTWLLSQALSTLPAEEVMLLRMKYEQQMDIHQIATQLKLTQSAVKMRLKRTRDKVRLVCQQIACS